MLCTLSFDRTSDGELVITAVIDDDDGENSESPSYRSVVTDENPFLAAVIAADLDEDTSAEILSRVLLTCAGRIDPDTIEVDLTEEHIESLGLKDAKGLLT